MADENNRVSCHWDGEGMDPYSCEPYSCHEEGTVWHLGADVPFCAHHFKKFEGLFGWQFPYVCPAETRPHANCKGSRSCAAQYTGTCIDDLMATTDRVLEASL